MQQRAKRSKFIPSHCVMESLVTPLENPWSQCPAVQFKALNQSLRAFSVYFHLLHFYYQVWSGLIPVKIQIILMNQCHKKNQLSPAPCSVEMISFWSFHHVMQEKSCLHVQHSYTTLYVCNSLDFVHFCLSSSFLLREFPALRADMFRLTFHFLFLANKNQEVVDCCGCFSLPLSSICLCHTLLLHLPQIRNREVLSRSRSLPYLLLFLHLLLIFNFLCSLLCLFCRLYFY